MSKRDFSKIIDEQQSQLQRYEKRLKDVVTAYKSLLKQKDALESTLKAITNSGEATATSGSGKPNSKDSTLKDTPTSSQDSAAGHVDEQVTILMKALATLNEEKSRTEAKFQADKRTLKRERDELQETIERHKLEWKNMKTKLKEQIDELKNKLWTQQMDREKEQKDHVIMLRELQTLVAIERSAKDQLENELEDLQQNLSQRSPFEKRCEEYQSQIQKLSEELEAVRNRLKTAEERSEKPEPLLLQLQQEMAQLKSQHEIAVLQEQRRANDAEEQLQQIAKSSEERVASLEAKLSELSEMVGSYDRTRQQDQQFITKLKERVSQLDVENCALIRAASTSQSPNEENVDKEHHLNFNDYSNLDVQSLMRKIIVLKGYLNEANRRSKNPVDVQAFLKEGGLSQECEHQACHEELQQLKEEYERYKLKVTSGSKNKIIRDNDHSNEVESLKKQATEMNNKIRALTNALQESETRYKEIAERSKATLERCKQQHNQEISHLEVEYRGKVTELEDQIQKQRQRAMALLQEKDDDIKLLKMSLGLFRPDAKADSKQNAGKRKEDEEEKITTDSVLEETEEKPLVLSEDLTDLLAGRNEGHLLYYLQEISRKNQEIAALRKAKHQLESSLRELHIEFLAEKEKYCEEIDSLKAEITRLDRNRSREGANLEYLKNVVYNYMLSSDVNSRQHMLNAIATLLEFSPKELANVKLHNSTWWWQPANKKPLAD